MKFSHSILLVFSAVLLIACDSASSESETLGYLRVFGSVEDGSEDWSGEGCEKEDSMTICQNPEKYEVKFIRVTPYACSESFTELCIENKGLDQPLAEIEAYGSLAPDLMNIIPYGIGFGAGRPITGLPYTAGGISLTYNYVEVEVSENGKRVRACHSDACGGVEGAKEGDLLYREAASEDYKWMDKLTGELKSSRPAEPVTLFLVTGEDSLDLDQFFVPEELLTFEKGASTMLNVRGDASNTLVCNDSNEDGECSFEWPEWYWPALPKNWTADLTPL